MAFRRQRYTYGRRGTPTIDALEAAINDLEGSAGTVICPSGLSAVSTALLSCLQAGDHLLMVDCTYEPVRHLADTVLKRIGVETTYFDPLIGSGIEALFTERTRAVYLESPGSLTFEMQDIRAIAPIARRSGATLLFDNTWASPLFFRPIEHGADLSIQAVTKYVGGHADVMLGTVAANASAWPALKETHGSMGLCAGPDDIFLALRGLRTLGIRLERQMRSALAIAGWLAMRSEVDRVLYPPLPGDPGHAIWERDMSGACGLLGFILAGWTESRAMRFVNGLKLFGIGASWGGFESLVLIAHPARHRTATRWQASGPLIRLHVGLEDEADLIADLDAAFAAAGRD
jgi:cystathionine beta-lyase